MTSNDVKSRFGVVIFLGKPYFVFHRSKSIQLIGFGWHFLFGGIFLGFGYRIYHLYIYSRLGAFAIAYIIAAYNR